MSQVDDRCFSLEVAVKLTLQNLSINYYLVETSADASRISVAFEEAKKTKRPVAVLVGDEYHGFNR